MVKKAFLVTLLVSLAGSAWAQSGLGALDRTFGQKPKFKFLIPSPDEESGARSGEEDSEDEVSVLTAVDALGRAFESRDADLLESFLVQEPRGIHLSLSVFDEERAHYGAAQVRHMFQRLFRNVRTQSFTYDSRDLRRHRNTAEMLADWTYTEVGSDEEMTVRLRFQLKKGETAWQIYEIRD